MHGLHLYMAAFVRMKKEALCHHAVSSALWEIRATFWCMYKGPRFKLPQHYAAFTRLTSLILLSEAISIMCFTGPQFTQAWYGTAGMHTITEFFHINLYFPFRPGWCPDFNICWVFLLLSSFRLILCLMKEIKIVRKKGLQLRKQISTHLGRGLQNGALQSLKWCFAENKQEKASFSVSSGGNLELRWQV